MIESYLESVAALISARGEADRELAAAERAGAAREEVRRAELQGLQRRLDAARRELAGLLERAGAHEIRIAADPAEEYAGGSDPLTLLEQTNARLHEALDAAINTSQAAAVERERARRAEEQREAEAESRRRAEAARAARADRRDRVLRATLVGGVIASVAAGVAVKSPAALAVPFLASLVVCYLADVEENTLLTRASAVAHAPGAEVWPWFATLVAAAVFGAYGLGALAGGGDPAAFGPGLGVCAACASAVAVRRIRPST